MKNLKGQNLRNLHKTHCKNGHEFVDENTYVTKEGWRQCRICKRLSDKRWIQKPGKKEMAQQVQKNWRQKNAAREKQHKYNMYNKIRKVIEDAKDAPCFDCGRKYPHYVMDFDHRNPEEKLINVGKTRSLKKTVEEIKKCDVVCANCHRIRTWKDVKRIESSELPPLSVYKKHDSLRSVYLSDLQAPAEGN